MERYANDTIPEEDESADKEDPDTDKDIDQYEYAKFVESYIKQEFAKLKLTKVAIKRLPPGYKEEEVLELLSPLPPHNYLYFYKPPKLAEFDFCTRPSLRINFNDPADAEWFIEKYNGYTICDVRGNEYKAITEYCPNQLLPDLRAEDFEKDELHGTYNPEEDAELIEELNTTGVSVPLISVDDMVKELEERVTNQSSDKTKITPLLEAIIQREKERRQSKISRSPRMRDSKSSRADEVKGGDKGRSGRDERKPKSKRKERRDRERRERRDRERAERYARERAEREKTPPKMIKRNRETEGNGGTGETVESKKDLAGKEEIPIQKKEENLKVESKAKTATPSGDPKRRDTQRNRGGRNYEDRDRRGRNYDERGDRGGRRNSGQGKFNNETKKASSNSNQEKKEESAQSSETKPIENTPDSNSKPEVKPGVASDEHKPMNEPPKKKIVKRYIRNRPTKEGEHEAPQEPSSSTTRSEGKEGPESDQPKKKVVKKVYVKRKITPPSGGSGDSKNEEPKVLEKPSTSAGDKKSEEEKKRHRNRPDVQIYRPGSLRKDSKDNKETKEKK